MGQRKEIRNKNREKDRVWGMKKQTKLSIVLLILIILLPYLGHLIWGEPDKWYAWGGRYPSTPTISLDSEPIYVRPRRNFTINIYVNDIKRLNVIQLELKWKGGLCRTVSVEAGPFLIASGLETMILYRETWGNLIVGCQIGGLGQSLSGSGCLLTVTFHYWHHEYESPLSPMQLHSVEMWRINYPPVTNLHLIPIPFEIANDVILFGSGHNVELKSAKIEKPHWSVSRHGDTVKLLAKVLDVSKYLPWASEVMVEFRLSNNETELVISSQIYYINQNERAEIQVLLSSSLLESGRYDVVASVWFHHWEGNQKTFSFVIEE